MTDDSAWPTTRGEDAPRAIEIRSHWPGDIGWVIHRQAILYVREFDFDGSFEALLAEIGAAFLRNFDPTRDACWIAECGGERLGAVALAREDDTTARLRILHVEASARGQGIGRRLVETCLAFAARAGYSRVTLWTNDINVAARRLYAACGFRCVHVEPPQKRFGRMLVGETWDIALDGAPPL